MSSSDNHNHHDEEQQQEEKTISDSFICCVCLDLLYKPIVLECGHVSCFWCVHKSMDPIRESHCPICRNPYHHFPTISEMLHFLLLKMYPLTYKRREKLILEEEKKMGFFSPQLDDKELSSVGQSEPFHDVNSLSDTSSASCVISEDKNSSKVESDDLAAIKKDNMLTINDDRTSSRVSSTDVLCPVCNQLLFRPAVLNCGHVYCEACITVPKDGIIICKVCESPHPSDCPNVCLELSKFLEEQFPEEYAARKENVECTQARFHHKNSSSCSGSSKSSKKESKTSKDCYSWWNKHGSNVHFGAGCDTCGMYPIVGDRYRCQDCVEEIGFDLCEKCYNTRSKRPGRFNQQHTSDHRFELVKGRDMSRNLVLRLVDDGSGAPVLAISAMGDSPDGWVAVESDVAGQILNDNRAVPDGNHDNSSDSAQNISVSIEHLVDGSGAPLLGIGAIIDSPNGPIALESDVAAQNINDNGVVPGGSHDNMFDNAQSVTFSMEFNDTLGAADYNGSSLAHDDGVEHKENDFPSTA